MSKKLIAFLSILSLSLSLFLIPANAGVKAGAKCKTAGITSDIAGEAYTCIKSGKKLVWRKGISKKTITTWVDISIDNLDLSGVPKKAYQNVSEVIQSRSVTSTNPTMILGPNLNKARVDQELPSLNRVIEFWGRYFIPEKIHILYVSKDDESWIEQKSIELGLSTMLPFGQTWKEQFLRKECIFGAAGKPQETLTYVQCLDYPFGDGNRQNAPHEYTHLFQIAVAKSNAFNISWYTEGSATFFGWTIANYGYNPNSIKRKVFYDAQFRDMNEIAKSDFRSRDLTKFKNRMQLLSGLNTFATSRGGSYWAGGLAFEVLVGLYGVEKFVEMTKQLEKNPDISSLLVQTYGFDADYFYEKLAPYVWAHIPS